MDKIEFLNILISLENESNSGLYNQHWRRPTAFTDGSKNNDYWNYHVSGVDGMQPEIDLKINGQVIYTYYNESDEPIIYTYEEFLNTHIYNK